MLTIAHKTFLLTTLILVRAVAQNATDPIPASPLPTGNAEIDKYNENYLKLTRSLMSPKSVADTFGRRIGRRYIAMQITVANRNGEYQWLMTAASVGLARLIKDMEKRCPDSVKSLIALTQSVPMKYPFNAPPNPAVNGEDLTSLRGVAEKGQYLDPRNLTLRLLRGSGTIAAGLLGVTTFGPAFAPAVAAFNGPLISAYETMFPNQTVNQLNRLNDSAYAANTVVSKQQAKVLTIFIPSSFLLTKAEQSKYYSDPNSTYSSCVDLRLLDAYVDGHFVTRLNFTPLITTVSITPAEAAKFATDNFKVSGTIVGRFMDESTLALSAAPDGLTIARDGDGTAERVGFVLSSVKPLNPNTPINIELRKAGQAVASYAVAAIFSAARPVILASGVENATIKQGEHQVVTINGTGFLPGARVVFMNGTGLTIGDSEYVNNKQLKVDIGAAVDAAEGPREFEVQTIGGSSGKALITIAKK